jgi:hypothetical protein
MTKPDDTDLPIPWTVMHPDASAKEFATQREATDHVQDRLQCQACLVVVDWQACNINLVAAFPEIDDQYYLY